MSNIYIQEPPTSGKVVMKTSVGDIDLELWTKETPKACRNFIQLCMEGYYDDTIFHRVVKGFIIQGGDPTGTGEGGESIYGHPFKDEFHSRLRFCRRGLLAMANAGKDDNGSQFFFTLGATPELQNKHTIFGKVTGETVYNMLKLEEALVDKNERPLYPQKIVKTEVLHNPFQDIVPRVASKKSDAEKEKKSEKKSGVKNFKLLSFGEEAEEDEEESVVLNKQFNAKGKSAHDTLSDPKLSSELAVEPPAPPGKEEEEEDSDLDIGPSVPAWVKAKDAKNNDWEDDSETQKSDESAALVKEKEEMKERVKNKLKEKSTDGPSKKMKTMREDKFEKNSAEDQKEEEEEEEYYLGKERHDERKRKAEEIRKEIRDLKRGVQKEKRAKELEDKEKAEKDEKKKQKSQVLEEFFESQKKYKDNIVVKKGASREQFTMQLLKKFGNKLQTAKQQINESDGEEEEEEEKEREKSSSGKSQIPKVPEKEDEEEDLNDESWMVHALRCEETKPVLAKDASTKDDDWFEIYDPRNPLNKRRRGESDQKRKDDRGSSRRRR